VSSRPRVVKRLNPTTVRAASVGFTLTVNGSGFIAPTFGPSPAPGTVVRFPVASNPGTPLGEGLPTAFVGSMQITALVPGSALFALHRL
jgi:hypothetical protein